MIDPETQRRLRERFSPDGSVLRSRQLRMLEMLREFDAFCSERGITYWLSSGTCIGAMRHGGFIPWDDDVDVEMLEPDYQRFLKEFGSEPRGSLVLQTEANEPSYILTFAKLRDLNSEISETSGYDRLFRYRGLFIDVFHISPSGSKFLRRLPRIICKKSYHFAGRADLTARIFNYLISKVRRYVFPVISAIDHALGRNSTRLRHEVGSNFNAPRDSRDLLPVRRVPFEGVMLPVPADAETYLTRLYGDWQNLPPLDSISCHF